MVPTFPTSDSTLVGCRKQGAASAGVPLVLASQGSGTPGAIAACLPFQSARRVPRPLAVYGSTNKYSPVNRSRKSGGSARKLTQTGGAS